LNRSKSLGVSDSVYQPHHHKRQLSPLRNLSPQRHQSSTPGNQFRHTEITPSKFEHKQEQHQLLSVSLRSLKKLQPEKGTMTEQDLVSTLNRQQEIDQLKLVIEDQLKKIIDKDETINKLKDQFNNLNEANEMTKQKCDNFLKLVDNQKIEIDMHKSENANQKNHLSKKVASQEVELNNYKNEINFLKNKLSMY